MSAIAGILHTNASPVRRDALERMVAALAHRGRDARGVWTDGSVGLGHGMFRETPESLNEQQPCLDKEAQLAVTADARIDNREDLIRQMGMGGRDALLISDGQMILQAYARWGEDCVQHLLGAYAFAIWDGRRRSLFCARDYIGLKPFFYNFSGDRFCFASEIKGIFSLGDVPRELDEEMIANYLALHFDDKEISFYKGILRLPPAHAMRVDAQGIHKRRYWQPDPVTELRLKSDGEYAEAFRHHFSEAIRCRLRTASPVGSTLSGGMDSSSITCMARDLLGREGQGRTLKVFSATFEHLSRFPQIDERRYQDFIIAAGGIDACGVPMAEFAPLASYASGQRFMEYPYMGFTHYMDRGLGAQINRQGVKTMLSGFGGDDVVCHGFGRLCALARKMRFISLYQESRALSQTQGVPAGRFLRHAIRPMVPSSLLSAWRFLRHGALPSSRGFSDDLPIGPDLAKRSGIIERMRQKEMLDEKPLTVRQEHAMALSDGLVAYVLENCDQQSYEFGYVNRFPFYDRRLAEFCLSLPDDQKMSRGWTRIVLRRALEGILPAENQWRRSKSTILPHFLVSLREREESLLLKLIEQVGPCVSQYVDNRKMSDLCHSFLSNGQKSDLYRSFWPAITLGIFLSEPRDQTVRKEAA